MGDGTVDREGAEESRFDRWYRIAGHQLGATRRPTPVFGPHHDLPWPGNAERTVAIACQWRSGSTLLSLALAGDRLAGRPEEYIGVRSLVSGWRDFGAPVPTITSRMQELPKRVLLRPGWWRHRNFTPGSFDRYWDETIRRSTTSSGVFGVKIL